MRIHTIAPGLYQSGTTLKLKDEALAAKLGAHGIDAVVNVWHRVDPRLTDHGAILFHYPFPDGRLTLQSRVQACWAAVAAAHACLEGRKVLVHCHAGRNRSGLVNAIVLHLLEGYAGATAMAIVRRQRPRAIANPEFASWLAGVPCRKPVSLTDLREICDGMNYLSGEGAGNDHSRQRNERSRKDSPRAPGAG